MIALGLDTSTGRGSVALLRDGQPMAEQSFWRGDGKRTPAPQHLFGAIDELLSEHRLAPPDIGLILVGVGPGSFTGIRVGIAAAKGLALPRAVPIKAVSSFDALALTALPQLPRDCQHLCVFGDARRDEIYWALYDRTGRPVRACQIGVLEEIADTIHDPLWFVSSEIERFREDIKETFGGFASTCPEPFYPSAAALAILGVRKFEDDSGQGDARLEPLYLRAPGYKKL